MGPPGYRLEGIVIGVSGRFAFFVLDKGEGMRADPYPRALSEQQPPVRGGSGDYDAIPPGGNRLDGIGVSRSEDEHSSVAETPPPPAELRKLKSTDCWPQVFRPRRLSLAQRMGRQQVRERRDRYLFRGPRGPRR